MKNTSLTFVENAFLTESKTFQKKNTVMAYKIKGRSKKNTIQKVQAYRNNLMGLSSIEFTLNLEEIGNHNKTYKNLCRLICRCLYQSYNAINGYNFFNHELKNTLI